MVELTILDLLLGAMSRLYGRGTFWGVARGWDCGYRASTISPQRSAAKIQDEEKSSLVNFELLERINLIQELVAVVINAAAVRGKEGRCGPGIPSK
jgi:hypothetical protein